MPGMKSLILSIMAMVLMFSSSATLAASKSALNDTEAMRTAQQWADLVGRADVSGLQTLLDEKYMHIHGTALVESKKQFLDAFTSGARKYDPVVFEDLAVRVFGNTAVVTGKFPLRAFAKGKTIEGVNRFSLVLVKDKTGCRVVSFQATAIPAPQ